MVRGAQDSLNLSHPGEESLLAMLDGELPREERRFVSGHLSECGECRHVRNEMAVLSRRVQVALEEAIDPSPCEEMPSALKEVVQAALVPITRRSWMILGRRSLATAATALLLLGGTAYAIPGSPVKVWVDDRVGALARVLNLAPASTVPMVAVAPKDGGLTVSFARPQSGVGLRVSLIQGVEAVVSGEGDFLVEQDHIHVDDPSGEIIIGIPRRAAHAAILVDELEVVQFDGENLAVTSEARATQIDVTVGDQPR